MYDYVIVTHLPAFYKVNLYNKLSKKLKIFVIFIASSSIQRTQDFVSLSCEFDHSILCDGDFEKRDVFRSILKLRKVISSLKFRKLLVSGWDLYEFWWLVMTRQRFKNAMALESTVLESRVDGLKGLFKKLFLSRVSTVFSSGKLHSDLLEKLNYRGEVKITKGVGIINKVDNLCFAVEKPYRKHFLYLGRLSPEKNVALLISVFNRLPDHKLSIVGNGPQEKELKVAAKSNIIFLGHIDNKHIHVVFENHDFLILPSLKEPWGLVVEEAFYFGVPVLVSKNCGVSELVESGSNGFTFDPFSEDELINIIASLEPLDVTLFRRRLCNKKFMQREKFQLEAYGLN